MVRRRIEERIKINRLLFLRLPPEEGESVLAAGDCHATSVNGNVPGHHKIPLGGEGFLREEESLFTRSCIVAVLKKVIC